MLDTKVQGTGLVEALISLLLLSSIFIAFEETQLFTFHQSENSLLFSIAVIQLKNISERLRVSCFNSDKHELPDLSVWNQENAEVLPRGRGEVSGHYPTYQITVRWGKDDPKNCKEHIGKSGCLSEEIHME